MLREFRAGRVPAGDLPSPALGLHCDPEAREAVAGGSAEALTREIAYTVPDQDRRIRPSRIPPRPASGFVISPDG